MSKFAIKNIEGVKGKQQIMQVVILKDTDNAEEIQLKINNAEIAKKEIEIEGVFDEYENSLEDKYESSLKSILGIMNLVADLQSVSFDKFKDVTPKGVTVKEYEFKVKDLRVYAIKIFNGQLILLGGYKNQQKSDYRTFRSLKEQYLEYIKKSK